MGKTLEECHKILGVDYGATEGIFFLGIPEIYQLIFV